MDCIRSNESTGASIDVDGIYGEGQFKSVYKGIYTAGPRCGQACVCKMFKTGGVFAASYFDNELAIVTKTHEIVKKFNAGNLINRKVLLNQPAVWTSLGPVLTSHPGERGLIEPMIENFQKFNSNSGWTDGDTTAWSEIMQALSHFSYHHTAGRLVLCDLQGGVNQDGAVLTDPVILSKDQSFGPTDLGQAGITTFFARHTCNQYCSGNWRKPEGTAIHFNATMGSTMIQVSKHDIHALLVKN